jgi:(1->4)-alpha-D-glucan 1-alpha-D-glucosylmutase
MIRYLGVVYFLRALPSAEEIEERYYQIMFVKEILWELYSNNETIRESIDNTLTAINGEPGNPSSFDHLDSILRDQNYRLSFWKVAVEEINYRRFFNINELISLRMEDEDVYARTHKLINKLVAEKDITGLRIDHVDGLYNPAAYLKRLNESDPDLYILVEKILELSEDLPDNWPVHGTTGYEFINYLNGLFIKRDNARAFTSSYQKFIRTAKTSKEISHEKKRLIIRARMAGEVERLAYLIESISSRDRYGIDITMHGLKGVLEEILTYFPVYRTYISRNDYSEQDRKYIDYVLDVVKKNNPGLSMN